MSELRALAANSCLNGHLFAGLTPKESEIILAAATFRRFPANFTITTQGSPANHLFLLIKGRARYFYTTSEGRKILLVWMAPGDVFGGVTILRKSAPYLVSCESVRDSEVLAWDRATIRRLAEKYPILFDNALSIAGEYLNWYMTAHVALSCHTARERLARALLGMSRAIGERVADGVEFDATNEELASAANITHYTASRLMSEWHKSRAVVKRRGKILLRCPERLLNPTV
jgi:CRP-like cAMP-binding protein